MDNPLRKIEELSMGLPVEERERLASRLFASVHDTELNEVDEAWLRVAEARIQAYRNGEDPGIPEADFFREIDPGC